MLAAWISVGFAAVDSWHCRASRPQITVLTGDYGPTQTLGPTASGRHGWAPVVRRRLLAVRTVRLLTTMSAGSSTTLGVSRAAYGDGPE